MTYPINMINKLTVLLEASLIYIMIGIAPFAGFISAFFASWYFMAMLKMNVIDAKHEGSWKQYFRAVKKSFIAGIKNKTKKS